MPNRSPARAIALHVIAFVILAGLIWVAEFLDLPHHLLGADKASQRLEEPLLESGLILLIGVPVVSWVTRTARRVAYLENFVVLCSWCRRVRLGQEWLKVEAFLGRHEAETSHGMCPDCEVKFDQS